MQTPQVLVANLDAETVAGQHAALEMPHAALLTEPITALPDVCDSALVYNMLYPSVATSLRIVSRIICAEFLKLNKS
jgi:hypothetical protein